MSQTRKPRQDRAESRRGVTRKNALGGLTLGGLWALAAHADKGADPAAEDHGDSLEPRQAAAQSPRDDGVMADAPAAALAQASVLHEELRQLVAGLVRETSHPAAPSRAPAPAGGRAWCRSSARARRWARC